MSLGSPVFNTSILSKEWHGVRYRQLYTKTKKAKVLLATKIWQEEEIVHPCWTEDCQPPWTFQSLLTGTCPGSAQISHIHPINFPLLLSILAWIKVLLDVGPTLSVPSWYSHMGFPCFSSKGGHLRLQAGHSVPKSFLKSAVIYKV